MNDFLNPKSMLTPGLAGSMCMAIANSLWYSFDVPQRYSSLALSYLFATVVLAASVRPLWKRGVFYLLNGLVIFSVAAGTNAAELAAAKAAEDKDKNVSVVAPSGKEGQIRAEFSGSGLPASLTQRTEEAVRNLVAKSEPGHYLLYEKDGSFGSLRERGQPTAYWVAPREESAPAVQVTLVERKPFFTEWF
jgi:hypothetical protein